MKTIWPNLFSILFLYQPAFSSALDSTKAVNHISGLVLITNNGISVVPAFSLYKPAGIVSLSMGNDKFSFEPEFRFSMTGRPWSFLFWGRYNFHKNKTKIQLGINPSLNFKTETSQITGDELILSRRFLAGELRTDYSIKKNITIGTYYLVSHGLDYGTANYTHFVALTSSFSNVSVIKDFVLRINPQFFYLKMDKNDGSYFSTSFSLSKKGFPISISAIINSPLCTNIAAGRPFIWNTSLVYTFSNNYLSNLSGKKSRR